MNTVKFRKVCRTCLKSYDANAVYQVDGNVEPFKKMTEYEFQKTLDTWFAKHKIVCDFCGSTFIEGDNIEINDDKLYDFNRLANECDEVDGEFFTFKILKKENQYKRTVGGKANPNKQFVAECFISVLKLLKSLPPNRFIHNPHIGDFLICLTGKFDPVKNTFNPRIQRLWCSGLTYDEIMTRLLGQLEEFDLFHLSRQ